MKRQARSAIALVCLWTCSVSLAACAASTAPNSGRSEPEPTAARRPVKVPTPPDQVGVLPSGVGVGAPVPVGQRTRVGDLDILVSAAARSGDGLVTDPVLGEDSYASEGKQFLLVPVEVSRAAGSTGPLPVRSVVVLSYLGASMTTPSDFATNCPYDETWPDKVDLWKTTLAVGETARGNACFIVGSERASGLMIGYAPFGTASGNEVYFRTS